MAVQLNFEAEIGRGRSLTEGLVHGGACYILDKPCSGIIGPGETRGILLADKFTLRHLGYMADFGGFISGTTQMPHHLKLALEYSNVPSLCGVSFTRQPAEHEEIIVNGFDGGVYSMTEMNKELLLLYRQSLEMGCQQPDPSSEGGDTPFSIRANADHDFAITAAFSHNARGIGLCRTGYLFFRSDHKDCLYRFLLRKERRAAKRVFELQEDDFERILKCVPDSLPITIRLWDMPLGEFFKELSEEDPAIGKRGVRIGFVCRELYELQIEALIQAFTSLPAGRRPVLEVLVPFVSYADEFIYWRDFIRMKNRDVRIGSMIETPRSILAISKIAAEADFLCIGSNDMTQLFVGMSRNESDFYFDSHPRIYGRNPFVVLDPWLKKLIHCGLREAREANPSIRCGIVGSHASFLENLPFLIDASFDYVSINYTHIDRMRSMCLTMKED